MLTFLVARNGPEKVYCISGSTFAYHPVRAAEQIRGERREQQIVHTELCISITMPDR
jgi:hypothetical protein